VEQGTVYYNRDEESTEKKAFFDFCMINQKYPHMWKIYRCSSWFAVKGARYSANNCEKQRIPEQKPHKCFNKGQEWSK